ncbi:hypothetical protein BDZ94DRAFT_1227883, partial [Collybia nuda]
MKIISSRWSSTHPNTPPPPLHPPPSPRTAMRPISPSMRGTPWFEDGNILISSGDGESVFKLYTGLLMYSSAHFEERLNGLSGDTTEVIDNCEKIEMDKDDSTRDLSHFFQAMHCGITITSLDSLHDLTTITSILRLATKYGAHALRARAVAVLQVHFPSTLSAFNLKITSPTSPSPWLPDPIIVINIARETSSFMLLPSAMALLTNDTSASEVFGVCLHATSPPRVLRHELNMTDALKFGLMKQLHQDSIAILFKFMRGVAVGCYQPPDMSRRCTRTAPI